MKKWFKNTDAFAFLSELDSIERYKFFYQKYYSFKKRCLLSYLDTYNIVYLNYNHRYDILNIIDVINNILDVGFLSSI